MPLLCFRYEDENHAVPIGDRTTIGRVDTNDICIPEDYLSREHALIVRENGTFHLRDRGSTNGIKFRGKRVESLKLEHGMEFMLGDLEFRFDEKELPEQEEQPDEEPETLTPATTKEPSSAPPTTRVSSEETEAAAELRKARDAIMAQLSKAVVGQKAVLHQILVALFARGHCLLIGVPGLAKTLIVRALGASLDLQTRRIQFTPDLMPSDITGTNILEEDPITRARSFRFNRGPLFTNMLLADEINRTPPKTQAALLEAMQEKRVTASGQTYDLPNPFFVIATQNPIEQEGTYPLPEAELDRFMFCVHVNYPSAAEEQQVILQTTRDEPWEIKPALDAEAILGFQQLVRQVPVSDHVALYATNLIRASRPGSATAPEFIGRWLRWGAGTRAGQYLILAAKAHAILNGRISVSCADIREYALPVLRHRIFCNFSAASEGITSDDVVSKLLDAVKEPEY